jgi:2-oxoglutarate ferredoxin oxidoreductase subunit delta
MGKVKGAIVIDRERCKGCEVCIDSCPFHVISMSQDVNAKGYIYAYAEKPDVCTGCVNCAMVCPDGVISVYRTKTE